MRRRVPPAHGVEVQHRDAPVQPEAGGAARGVLHLVGRRVGQVHARAAAEPGAEERAVVDVLLDHHRPVDELRVGAHVHGAVGALLPRAPQQRAEVADVRLVLAQMVVRQRLGHGGGLHHRARHHHDVPALRELPHGRVQPRAHVGDDEDAHARTRLQRRRPRLQGGPAAHHQRRARGEQVRVHVERRRRGSVRLLHEHAPRDCGGELVDPALAHDARAVAQFVEPSGHAVRASTTVRAVVPTARWRPRSVELHAGRRQVEERVPQRLAVGAAGVGVAQRDGASNAHAGRHLRPLPLQLCLVLLQELEDGRLVAEAGGGVEPRVERGRVDEQVDVQDVVGVHRQDGDDAGLHVEEHPRQH